ncbi:MAG: HPr family phosphocarrier protein [Alphaproteobacteria bacterium]|nr:HPr family phosphocarrier protein [Alphaproteobacteria bacterium]
MTGTAAPEQRQSVRIVNERGLHARAAVAFTKLARSFDAEIRVSVGETEVAGDSIMGLMLLAAGLGTDIAIVARGPAADAALVALVALVARGFDEI